MVIKYNPYNWEIRPRKESKDIVDVSFNVDIDEERIIKTIFECIEISLIELKKFD